ncbi:MAG TPA: class I SAM-dependent methyltransferase [Streptosporangiaceae bacterium]|nr:class I SAM-dependent methyltransferase [Streptosporangiaceae bacterium]
MAQGERERLRATFTEDAELYDRARPGYPREAIDDLAELADLGPGRRTLEIGCGTGRLTVPLAERGCEVTAVELGAEMAAVARRKLASFASVTVVTDAFERWMLPDRPFDAVVAASAFHWIDPAVRMHKIAEALRAGGALATITNHAAGGRAAFFAEVRECYERLDAAGPVGLSLPTDGATASRDAELDSLGRFGPVTVRRYEWELTYSTARFLELMRTSAAHRALDPAAQAALLECVGRVIDERHGGALTKRHVTELHVTYRR